MKKEKKVKLCTSGCVLSKVRSDKDTTKDSTEQKKEGVIKEKKVASELQNGASGCAAICTPGPEPI